MSPPSRNTPASTSSTSGSNSTTAAAGTTFNKDKLTAAFRKLEKDGYIKKFIDETAKTNKCWHLEIVPNAKTLV